MKFSILTTAVALLLSLATTATARPQIQPAIINLAHRASADAITITCTNHSIDYVDSQSAAHSLGDSCTSHGGMTSSTKISWIAHKTRVYACNWSSTAETSCSQDEIVHAQNAIMGVCGVNQGGYWYNADLKKTYGNDAFDQDWCDGLSESHELNERDEGPVCRDDEGPGDE